MGRITLLDFNTLNGHSDQDSGFSREIDIEINETENPEIVNLSTHNTTKSFFDKVQKQFSGGRIVFSTKRCRSSWVSVGKK